jgi:hypothetical protein
MCSAIRQLNQLTLLLKRLMDADTLLAEDSVALQTQADAVGRALAQGDLEAARRHVERLAQLTEALVNTDALDLENGRAVIEMAHRLLNESAE